jgi:PAS domain S-box-containing protein
MAGQFIFYYIAIMVAITLLGWLVVYAWQHRTAPGAVSLAWFAMLGLWAALAEGLSVISPTPEQAAVWRNAREFGFVSLPVVWLTFSIDYSGRAAWLKARRLAALSLIPAISLIIVWTNSAHGLWTQAPITFIPVGATLIADKTTRQPGAWYMFYQAYVYILIGAGAVMLFQQALRQRNRLHRGQIALVGLGALLAAGLALASNAAWLPGIKIDLAIPALAAGGLLITLATFRYQFLDLSPVARDTLIDRLDDGMLVLDAQSRVVDLNPAMQAWLQQGYAAADRQLPAQLVGRLAVEVLSPWPNLVELCQALHNSQSEFSFNLRGVARYFDFRLSLVIDRRQRLVGRWIMLRDITLRKQAEIELQKLSRAVHYSPVSFVITDVTGAIEYVNLKFSDVTGYTFYEALGQNPRLLQSGQTPPEVYRDLWKTIQSGREWRGEFANRKKNGEIYWEDAVIAPIMTDLDEITHFVAVKEDITKRKQAEEALHQYTAELEASNAELDAFAHTVAHDLNNPLSMLMGFGELLEEHWEALAREDISDSLSRMAQTSRKMSRIVNELLLLASVRKMDEVNVDVLDMRAIVAETVERSADLVAATGAQIVVPETWPAALGYGSWVEEIWSNYVSNAIKYGGTPPRVVLGADRAGDKVRFWVRDNGAGLTADQQSRLFTEFTRLHSTRATGHGLGLSIVKRIADKLGGQVGVESEVGHGSLFYFTLPPHK